MDYGHLRKCYDETPLSKKDLDPSPISQLQSWLNEAIGKKILEPNAMTLATATQTGVPSSRTVLLKGCEQRGLIFFTNYQSRKSQEIAGNSEVSLTLFWKELQKQVIVNGVANKLSEEESTAYFSSRPRGSQLAAWASRQDAPIKDRKELITQFKALSKQYPNQIPKPPFWGGFLVIPHRFEFWKGRKDRLHDRFTYEFLKNRWEIQRVSP